MGNEVGLVRLGLARLDQNENGIRALGKLLFNYRGKGGMTGAGLCSPKQAAQSREEPLLGTQRFLTLSSKIWSLSSNLTPMLLMKLLSCPYRN